jgi:hypothetical protein
MVIGTPLGGALMAFASPFVLVRLHRIGVARCGPGGSSTTSPTMIPMTFDASC